MALALAPPLNHSWAIALHLTARGLTTRRLAYQERSFTMEFDFVGHQLLIRVSDGGEAAVRLEPKTVADFYREAMTALRDLGIEVSIWSTPVEIPTPVPFERDIEHGSYDPLYANRWWRVRSN